MGKKARRVHDSFDPGLNDRRMGLACMEAISPPPGVSYYGFPMKLSETPEGYGRFAPAARVLRPARRLEPDFYAKADLLPPISAPCSLFLRKGIHKYSRSGPAMTLRIRKKWPNVNSSRSSRHCMKGRQAS